MIINLNKFFNTTFNLFSGFILLALCVSCDVPRPRGVSLAKASLYSPTKDFTCFDGSTTIPFSQVNDDYCDCFDGSDEPGTSACMNGVFHCANRGHRALNIPSSRVNDGVCDCCDGTDEYIESSIVCNNICEELGKEARAEALRLAEVMKAGSQIRLEYIEKGNLKRNELAQQLKQLEKDKNEAEQLKTERQSILTDLEAKENEVLKVYREAEEKERAQQSEEDNLKTRDEASKAFISFDSDGDGALTIDELKKNTIFDKNHDGEVSDEEANYFLTQTEPIDLDTFITNVWPLTKPLLMAEAGIFKGPKDEVEEFQDQHEEEETGPQEEEEEENQEHEELEEEQPGQENNNADFESDLLQHTTNYDPDTQKIVDAASEARKQLTDAERSLREIDSSIRTIQQSLEKDYGLHQEFASLDGQCLEHEDKEYIYRLCLFQKVTQKAKNGGSEVGLGNWGEWAGPEGKHYSVMKYTQGMSCWNGPNRSTTVNVVCGLETKIISVNEPFRCEYKMELSTPAACDEALLSHPSHDEL